MTTGTLASEIDCMCIKLSYLAEPTVIPWLKSGMTTMSVRTPWANGGSTTGEIIAVD